MATNQQSLATGWNLIQAGDLAGAREHFLELTQADPSFAQAWYLLGSVNQLLGNITESLANYERVLRLDPNHVAALNNLGVALQAVGMPREAAASLRIAIRNKPDYAEAHSNLGNALKDQGDLDGAVACYRRAIEIDPSYFDAYNNLGNGLRAQGHLAESVACYEQALELKPGNPQMHLNRALAWLQMGDFERGWPEYEWRLKCNEYAIPAIPAAAVGWQSARWPDDLALRRPWVRRYASVHSLCASGTRTRGPRDRGVSESRSPGCWQPVLASKKSWPKGRRCRISPSLLR